MDRTVYLRTWLEVDTDALRHNIRAVRKCMAPAQVIAVVKADAYGLGAVQCARIMAQEGIRTFAVACLKEALALREAGIQGDILILGYTPPVLLGQVADKGLIQTAVDADYAEIMSLAGRALQRPLRCHVKLDTGMSRLGVPVGGDGQDVSALLQIYSLPFLQIEGLYTHYAVSDEDTAEADAFTAAQTERFRQAVQAVREAGYDPGICHTQNSAAILRSGSMGWDACRAGLLYTGIPAAMNPSLGLQPVAALRTRVASVKTIQPGDTVGYGRTYAADRPARIATLAVGYADGLPRACSGKGARVLIHGQEAVLVGNICMDQCMADVTGIENVRPGDTVTIFGRDGAAALSVDDLAEAAGTIPYEILTGISPRADRLYVSAQSPACA